MCDLGCGLVSNPHISQPIKIIVGPSGCVLIQNQDESRTTAIDVVVLTKDNVMTVESMLTYLGPRCTWFYNPIKL